VLVHAVDYNFTRVEDVLTDFVEKYKIPVHQVVDGPRMGDLLSISNGDPAAVEQGLSNLERIKALSKYGSFVTFESVQDDVGLTQARFAEAMSTSVLPLVSPRSTPALVRYI
jgi:hypothetical protein